MHAGLRPGEFPTKPLSKQRGIVATTTIDRFIKSSRCLDSVRKKKGGGTEASEVQRPRIFKSQRTDFQSIDFHRESGTSAAAKNTPSTVRSCEDNANTLVPHRAIRRSGQRLQMSAMPHLRRRVDTASRRGSLSTDAEIFDELHALVLWDLRGGRDTGCRS